MIKIKSTRHNFKIDSLRGVDLTSHPANVQKNRATYMKNMVNYGGINHKRRGFHQIYELLSTNDTPLKINGLHICTLNGKEELIIHAGTDFYKENGDKIPKDVSVSDTKSQAFCTDKEMIIVGCGGIYTYNGEKISSIIPYVPTIRKSYDCRYDKGQYMESPNYLTPKRKELFCGKLFENERNTYLKLDTNADYTKGITITASLSPIHNELRICEGESPNPDTDSLVSNDVTVIFHITEEKLDLNLPIDAEPVISNGKRVYFLDSTTSSDTVVYPTVSTLFAGSGFTFNFNATPSTDDEYNILIEYSTTEDKGRMVQDCIMGALSQDNRGSTRLVLSGNGQFPNFCCFSDGLNNNGINYFPEACGFYVGDGSPVTSLYNLSNTYVGVFKKNSFFRYAIYHYPKASALDEQIYINGYESQDNQGCVSPFVCATSNGDYLVFDGDGVFGITDVSSSSDRSYLAKRSINIEGGLKKHSYEDILNAVGCELDGRYYLFIGNRAYVADTRYTFREGGALGSHYQYEWWVWTCPKVRCAIKYKDKLYMGTEDGRIYTQGEDFRDIKIVKSAKDGDYVYKDGGFYINESIPLTASTKLMLKGVRSFLKNGEFTASYEDGILKIMTDNPYSQAKELDNVVIKLSDGDEFTAALISIPQYDEVGALTLLPHKDISDINPDSILEICLLETHKGEYTLKKEGDVYVTYYKDKAVHWHECYDLFFIECHTVEAEFYTPMLNFDEPMRTKTLIRIGVSSANEDSGSVNFGWDTRKSTLSRIDGIDGLDFASFDFDKLSFEFPFAKTYERRVFERNFNYIMFKFSSKENKDCAINEIYGLYTVNNYIQGVR